MTEKLYELNSYCKTFTATVLECHPDRDGYAVRLDSTAFFPEGGGQAADPGTLNGVPVTDVQMADGDIWHYTAAPLVVGETVEGALDWEIRFARMQHHTAEHIVCGIAHRWHGLTNVGFHLGSEDVTLDLDGELNRQQIDAIEDEANRVVWANRTVTPTIPTAEELATITYRSKKELEGDVRLVTIDGVTAAPVVRPTWVLPARSGSSNCWISSAIRVGYAFICCAAGRHWRIIATVMPKVRKFPPNYL